MSVMSFYFMVQTAAAAIIQNKKILLLKRSLNVSKYPGFWTFPGGRSNVDETPEETVVREVKEETSLDFEPSKKIFEPEHPDNGTYIFMGSSKGTISIQEEEAQKYDWFSFEETSTLDIAFSFKKHIQTLHKLDLI